MPYNRVLSVQDISCVGQCSLTVALPILSACGQETCILPTAVLSTHTGGSFKNFTFRDLTDDLPRILDHWVEQGISFDAVYTGYLGNVQEISYVKDIFEKILRKNGVKFVDPAMGDDGVLYTGFDRTYADAMKSLCGQADIIFPNITEASIMTGNPFRSEYGADYINKLVDELFALGSRNIILTGVSYSADKTGVYVCTANERRYYQHERVERTCHGTGDIYASTFIGSYLSGRDLFDSAKIAADFTVSCIEETIDDPEHWYGVKFERVLPNLIDTLRM